MYSWAFLLHFIAIFLLSLIEQKSLGDSLINYGRAGSWSSILMIVILVGSFLGGVMSFIIGFNDFRETFLVFGLFMSIVMKICIGNALLIYRSVYSILALFCFLSAIIDTFNYKYTRDGVNFTAALIQMVIDTTRVYSVYFFFACFSIVFVQTLILLWWGAFFIGLLSTAPIGYAVVLTIIMLLSLYWITQFFHGLVAFVVGGSVLWTFLREDTAGYETVNFSDRLLLYMQCGLTTSLGTLCKAALFVPISDTILALHLWVNRRPHAAAASSGITNCTSIRRMVACVLSNSIIDQAYQHNRLALSLAAVYGRSYCVTASAHANTYPETLDIATEDSTYRILNACAISAASVISLLFALVDDAGGAFEEEGDNADSNSNSSSKLKSLPLFFLLCFYLSYCGISLTMHVYSSAVDGLIVGSAISPVKFARQNQIVFLRFLRNSESGLR